MVQKTKKAVIFGTGSFAEVVSYLLEKDSPYEIAAYTKTTPSVEETSFLGKPVIDFDRVVERYDPECYEMFVAIGYAKLNKIREEFCNRARKLGYRLLSYISTRATSWDNLQMGDNVFIFEHNNIQPFVSIGEGTILWSGNHVGHHSTIGNYCFITSHVVVSGHCNIGARCFIGVNATIADQVCLEEDNLIGASAYVHKNTEKNDVFVSERAKKINKSSQEFFK